MDSPPRFAQRLLLIAKHFRVTAGAARSVAAEVDGEPSDPEDRTSVGFDFAFVDASNIFRRGSSPFPFFAQVIGRERSSARPCP
jgi:hypothetical protein